MCYWYWFICIHRITYIVLNKSWYSRKQIKLHILNNKRINIEHFISNDVFRPKSVYISIWVILVSPGIMWCCWQISKWLWYIGRLILATDNCSTHPDLSHCHSATINTRETDLGMNAGIWTAAVAWLPVFLSYFLFWLILWL